MSHSLKEFLPTGTIAKAKLTGFPALQSALAISREDVITLNHSLPI